MSADESECEFSFSPSDEEIDAARWLLDTLSAICDHKRKNADKALLVKRLLHKWGENQALLHERIHYLEDVLHSKGYVEVIPEPRPRSEVN
jgi:hypothetical protein